MENGENPALVGRDFALGLSCCLSIGGLLLGFVLGLSAGAAWWGR